MFGFLSFILFFVFIILIIGLAIAAKVVGAVWKAGKRMTGGHTQSTTRRTTYANQDSTSEDESAYASQASGQSRSSSQHKSKRKIFDADEGEYIDFEEIKETE